MAGSHWVTNAGNECRLNKATLPRKLQQGMYKGLFKG